MEWPQNRAAAPDPNTATLPVIFANRYAFAKAQIPKRHASNDPRQLRFQLPLQPWTWLQLAMNFCFTGSGNGTKSNSAAI